MTRKKCSECRCYLKLQDFSLVNGKPRFECRGCRSDMLWRNKLQKRHGLFREKKPKAIVVANLQILSAALDFPQATTYVVENRDPQPKECLTGILEACPMPVGGVALRLVIGKEWHFWQVLDLPTVDVVASDMKSRGWLITKPFTGEAPRFSSSGVRGVLHSYYGQVSTERLKASFLLKEADSAIAAGFGVQADLVRFISEKEGWLKQRERESRSKERRRRKSLRDDPDIAKLLSD